MTDEVIVDNYRLEQYKVRSTTIIANSKQIQHIRLDKGSGQTESIVTDANPLPVTGSISPAAGTTLENYHINDIDDAAVPKYFGFEDKDGNWYIMRESPAKSYRYSAGSSGYAAAWTARAAQVYDYYSVTF